MTWALACELGGASLLSGSTGPVAGADNPRWTQSTADFSVSQACPSQWLELRGLPLDSRAPMTVWFDQVAITSLVSR
jgi:hypothetical protein